MAKFKITGNCPDCGDFVEMNNGVFRHNCQSTGLTYRNTNKVFVEYFDNIKRFEVNPEKAIVIDDNIF